ncbi:MAG: hypothetical protein WDZ52_01615 [Pseudohongiellaceae bacterium]
MAGRRKQNLGSLRSCSLVAMLLCLLASCLAPDIDDWPDTIPSKRLFIAAYAADEENQGLQSQTEYLEWTLVFYQGNLTYQSGWADISSNLFPAPSAQQRDALLAKLRELGVAIGSEWSRHNDIRQIDSRMLSLWGSTIQLAPDFETQRETVELIAEDVELLLNGRLDKGEILETRYATLLGVDLIEGF